MAENSVHLLIHEHARQLAGLPLHLHAAPRPLHDVSAGLSRLAKPFGNLDRLAHRRAERMRLELNGRPLSLGFVEGVCGRNPDAPRKSRFRGRTCMRSA